MRILGVSMQFSKINHSSDVCEKCSCVFQKPNPLVTSRSHNFIRSVKSRPEAAVSNSNRIGWFGAKVTTPGLAQLFEPFFHNRFERFFSRARFKQLRTRAWVEFTSKKPRKKPRSIPEGLNWMLVAEPVPTWDKVINVASILSRCRISARFPLSTRSGLSQWFTRGIQFNSAHHLCFSISKFSEAWKPV